VLWALSPNERLQYALHPWTSFVIVPVFALANAGIDLRGDVLAQSLTSPITLGVVVGLVLGKPAGIVGASWLASRRWLGGCRSRSAGRHSSRPTASRASASPSRC
jgi:Na+/H+ antiporter NhaA